jgi:peptidoglycan/LPS O-acetylase OafA/YrhL
VKNPKNPHYYRDDIDGLRAIAVLAVYFFHCGLLPNGYLGVDIFFAISGYLITGILAREAQTGTLSILDFYGRRVRRIIPLCLLVSFFALLLGYFVMLPDDLENLAQSVIATNLFSNNILQAVTTRDYWDVVNDFKPLMHTWSLGVEEQYYVFFPIIFLLVGKARLKLVLPITLALTIASYALTLLPQPEAYQKFFFLPFRFWEISAGALLALTSIRFEKLQLPTFLTGTGLLVLAAVMIMPSGILPPAILTLVTVLASLLLLAPSTKSENTFTRILTARPLLFVGKISYSFYMWHQVFLAYCRYIIVDAIDIKFAIWLLLLIIFTSYLSYQLIEQPYRDRKKVSPRTLVLTLLPLFIFLLIGSYEIYNRAGIVRDVPELDLSSSERTRGKHAQYNSRVFKFTDPFLNDGRVKVLVVGNSFARDWCNVLLESEFAPKLDISYSPAILGIDNDPIRSSHADLVFWVSPSAEDIKKANISLSKLWVIGTKNFGVNNGRFYNYRGSNYFNQRTSLQAGVLESYRSERQIWGDRYIDLLEPILDTDDRVPVFTPDRKFISQDTRHLTRAGAQFYASLVRQTIDEIIQTAK